MIEFLDGPNKEPNIKDKEQMENIINALQKCNDETSWFYWLNIIYNNGNHFFSQQYAYNIHTFLKELSMISNSIKEKIQIMGGVHNDTGHTSGILLIKPKEHSQPYGAFVTDTYIRFVVKLSAPRRLHVLNETSVFHFLVNVPQLSWTPDMRNGTLIVQNIPKNISEEQAEYFYPHVNGVHWRHLRVQREG